MLPASIVARKIIVGLIAGGQMLIAARRTLILPRMKLKWLEQSLCEYEIATVHI